jgi:hypothetical protein
MAMPHERETSSSIGQGGEGEGEGEGGGAGRQRTRLLPPVPPPGAAIPLPLRTRAPSLSLWWRLQQLRGGVAHVLHTDRECVRFGVEEVAHEQPTCTAAGKRNFHCCCTRPLTGAVSLKRRSSVFAASERARARALVLCRILEPFVSCSACVRVCVVQVQNVVSAPHRVST